MKQKLIPILDNGHGQETPGKRSPVWKDGTQLFEYEFNRDIVKRIVKKLKCAGIEHKNLVPELTDVTLGERCRRANKMHKDSGNKCFLISVHANAGGGTGFEVFTSVGTTKADAMATIMFKEMVVNCFHFSVSLGYNTTSNYKSPILQGIFVVFRIGKIKIIRVAERWVVVLLCFWQKIFRCRRIAYL